MMLAQSPIDENRARHTKNILPKAYFVFPRCLVGIGFGRTGQRGKQIAPPNRRVIIMQMKYQELSACRFILSDKS